MLSVPVRAAPAVGANLTLTVHVPLTANEAAQVVLTKLKSVPLTDAAVGTVRVNAPPPVLVSVAVSDDDDPLMTLPKAIEALSVAVCSHTPVPVKLAVLVPAPVTMLSAPVRAAPAVGVNLTLTVHVPLTANDAVQVVLAKLKSVPVTDAAVGTVTVRGPAPVLVSVAVSVDEEPVVTLPKATGVLNVAVCSSKPVPVRLAVWVPAPVTILMVPVRAVPAVGVNLTLTVQLAPAGIQAVHVVLTKLKSAPVTEAAVGTVTFSALVPVLVRVLVSVEEVPVVTLPKARVPKVAANGMTLPVPLIAVA